LREYLERSRSDPSPLGFDRREGFRLAVVDPAIHALHVSLLRGERKVAQSIAARRRVLREKALVGGPDGLAGKEKKTLLCDPACLRALHIEVWELPDEIRAKSWGLQTTTPSA
jgi:membrane glycosyltransferase